VTDPRSGLQRYAISALTAQQLVESLDPHCHQRLGAALLRELASHAASTRNRAVVDCPRGPTHA
jgi:hypothetical protein